MARVRIDRNMHCAGERLEVVKKQLKVQKKQQKATPVKDSPKKKLKGIRIRKGVRIRVGPFLHGSCHGHAYSQWYHEEHSGNMTSLCWAQASMHALH